MLYKTYSRYQLFAAVISTFGILLIEAFNTIIRWKSTTHTILIKFNCILYEELEEQASFKFINPIATKPFDKLVGNVVKYFYHQEVVEAIKQYNSQLKNECIPDSRMFPSLLYPKVKSQKNLCKICRPWCMFLKKFCSNFRLFPKLLQKQVHLVIENVKFSYIFL